MAGGIVRDVREGRRVHVYLMNAGYRTGVKGLLCAQGICLTDEEITATRNAEILTSLENLGVPAGNVHMLYIQEERGDAPGSYQAAIDAVIARLGPAGRYRSMSWMDAHPGHYNVAYALRAGCDAARVGDCQFFQSPLYIDRSDALQYNPVVTPIGEVLVTPQYQTAAAGAAYRENAPEIGRYAIGARSVPSQIAWAEDVSYSWEHGRTWASAKDESAAAQWLADNQPSGVAARVGAAFPLEEEG